MRAFAVSLCLHAAALAWLFAVRTELAERPRARPKAIFLADAALSPYRLRTPLPKQGGGGGGAGNPMPASRGPLPRPALRQFAPPSVEPRKATLLVEATIIAPEDLVLPRVDIAQYGDPFSKSLFASDGPGHGGGIGSGCCGGVGPGKGPGAGPGDGGGVTVSAASWKGVIGPVLIYKVEPEYSEEARKARQQGTVVLVVEVDTTGRPVRARVVQPLGLGLDEKALEAVSRWRFRPGRRDGQPVVVPALVEVNFRLL